MPLRVVYTVKGHPKFGFTTVKTPIGNRCAYPVTVKVIVSSLQLITSLTVVSNKLSYVLWVFSILPYLLVHSLFIQGVGGTSGKIGLLLSSVTFLVITDPTYLLDVFTPTSTVGVELPLVFRKFASLTNDNFSVHTNDTDSSFLAECKFGGE